MSNSEKSAWDGYRKWQKTSWITAPISFGFFIFADRNPFLFFLAVLFAIASVPSAMFRCPQCGECFFFRIGAFNWKLFPQKCAHCGFPKWEEPSPELPKVDIDPISCSTSSLPYPVTKEHLSLEQFLTLVFRDDPGAIHLSLDSEGWADVNNLLTRANRYGFKLTREDLAEVLTVPENPSFEWDQRGDRIRWGKG